MSAAPVARPRFKRPTFLVYNPMDTSKDQEALGTFYHWDPMDSCEIGDAYTWPKDGEDRIITTGRRVLIEGGDAHTVATLICSADHLGPLGFCILEGTVKEQQQIMRDARQQWIRVRSDEVDAIIDAWEHYVASSRRSGSLPPRPPKREQRAYADREKFSFDGESRKPFVCDHCGLDFDQGDQRRSHIAVHHPGANVPDAPVDEQPTKSPDIKKGKALISAAKDSMLELSIADRKGLSFGDQEVIADVAGRIDKLEEATDDGDAAGGIDMSPEPKGPNAAVARAQKRSKETVN